MLASYRGSFRHIRDNDNNPDDNNGGGGSGRASTTATSWASLVHTWLNTSLTNAFASSSHCRDNGGGSNDNGGDEVSRCPGQLPPPSLPTSMLHYIWYFGTYFIYLLP
jgi:hypothetical protein